MSAWTSERATPRGVRPNPDGAAPPPPAASAQLEEAVSRWLRDQGVAADSDWRDVAPPGGPGDPVASLRAGAPLRRLLALDAAGRPADPRRDRLTALVRSLGYEHRPDRMGGLRFFPATGAAPTPGVHACEACRARVADAMRFCQECGAAQARAPRASVLRECGRCGREAPDHHAFCAGCGAPLGPLGVRPNPGTGPLAAFLRGAPPRPNHGGPVEFVERAYWGRGGCLEFARVLRPMLRGSTLVDLVEPEDVPGGALAFPGAPHHVVVAWRGLYVDAEGAHDPAALLARWDEAARAHGAAGALRAEPHDPRRAADCGLRASTWRGPQAETLARRVAAEARADPRVAPGLRRS